ncbi:hypothetical protein EV361DRAFT_961939 [Lentinula raphanica]|nr:hypothetical protein EV361DRAFT_961939 [Lentinula raphanica]
MRFHHLVFFGVLLAVLAFAAPVPLQARTSPSLAARSSKKEVLKCQIEYLKDALPFEYKIDIDNAKSVMEDTVRRELKSNFRFAKKTKNDPVFYFVEDPGVLMSESQAQASIRVWVKKDGKMEEYKKKGKMWIETDIMSVTEEPKEK